MAPFRETRLPMRSNGSPALPPTPRWSSDQMRRALTMVIILGASVFYCLGIGAFAVKRQLLRNASLTRTVAATATFGTETPLPILEVPGQTLEPTPTQGLLVFPTARPSPTPTAAATPAGEPTLAASPTTAASPQPSRTPVATLVLRGTPSPTQPPASLTPSAEPKPTATPSPEATTEPTAAPEPSRTPASSNTPESPTTPEAAPRETSTTQTDQL